METRDPSDIDRKLSEPVLARRNTLDMSQPEPAERLTVPYFHDSAAPPRDVAAKPRRTAVGICRPGYG